MQPEQTEDQDQDPTKDPKSVAEKSDKEAVVLPQNPKNDGAKSDDEDLWDNVPI